MNTPNNHDPVKGKKHFMRRGVFALKEYFSPKGHFAVSASPFNGVKLELALILIVGLILWLVFEQLFPHRIEAFLMLVGYSLLAAGWIILRVRNTVKQLSGQAEP